MKKSSLGRRSTLKDANSKKPENSERKTGIPIFQRASSALSLERPSSQPRKRVLSADRASICRERDATADKMCDYNSTPYQGCVSRTPRALTMSTGRLSSISSKKGDTRPLTDKEWQAEAVKTVVRALSLDMEGSSILQTNRGVKASLTLACFIDICNYLLNKLDPKIEINKSNYVTELQYFLKKLAYKGKMDKMVLQTVYTLHAWPYVLGIFHFLSELVLAAEDFKVHQLNIMFPNKIEKDSSDTEEFNFKVLLPIFKYLWDQHQLEKCSVEEVIETNMPMVHELQRNSGYSTNIFDTEKDLMKVHEEAQKKHQETIDTFSDFQSQASEKFDDLMKTRDKTKEISAELGELKLELDRMRKRAAEMDNEMLHIDKERKAVDTMVAQHSESDENSLTPSEYEKYKDLKGQLKEDLKFDRQSVFYLEEALLSKRFSIAKLKRQVEKLFNEYNSKIVQVVQYDISIQGAMCHSRPCLGKTPCNDATANLLNTVLKSFQNKADQYEQFLQGSSDESAEQFKLSEQIKDARHKLDIAKAIQQEELRKHEKLKSKLLETLMETSKEKEMAEEKLRSAEKRVEENHKEYLDIENEIKIKEESVRKLFNICQRKLEIRNETIVDLEKKILVLNDKFKEQFQGLSDKLDTKLAVLKKK